VTAGRASPVPASAHILATIADPGAGPSYSVGALAASLDARGARTELHTVRGWRDSGAAAGPAGVPLTAHRQDFPRTPLLGAMCLSGDLDRALRQTARSDVILHGHGLWLMPNIYPSWAARRGRARVVISPRGMLSAEALAFSRLRKRAFWRMFQARVLAEAACLHATSAAELGDIRAAGLTNPVAVIPNGVQLPPPTPIGNRYGPPTVLSLGRVHPKKGLDVLLRAWAGVEADHPDWRLRIIGPAEHGHDDELKALSAALNLRRVSIEGPAYGPARLAAYRDADLFVLPTRSENFAMTVAEALGAGIPVISSKGAPWAGLEVEGCGWWIDHGPEPLAATLQSALDLPRESLRSMGARGREWMARDFSWDRIAGDMLAVYAWLAGGAERPVSVQLD
jgi:glycosyltransferase involved in cell wall biosynthesis